MAKEQTISVKGFDVKINERDFISLTDIAKWKNPIAPSDVVKNWMRTTDTVDFLGLWETLNNPDFNSVEFDLIKSKSGRNAFTLSPTQWVEKTNAIGIIAGRGKYSDGTLAHEDIALEFLSWISTEFKLHFIYEFKRLKIAERKQLEWTAKRELAKINYHLQTNAIAENLIVPTLTDKQKLYTYTDEADLLNVALFGITAKEWRERNPDKDRMKENIRDYASVPQLLVLAQMEILNAELINQKIAQNNRIEILNKMAKQQLANITRIDNKLLLPKGK